jgi:hypothetical protein
VSEKKRFRLSFGSTEVYGPGLSGKQRALIIAVSSVPGVNGWVQAVLACEDGSMQVKTISQIQFDLSQRDLVVLAEVDGERAAPVIYTLKTQANGG